MTPLTEITLKTDLEMEVEDMHAITTFHLIYVNMLGQIVEYKFIYAGLRPHIPQKRE